MRTILTVPMTVNRFREGLIEYQSRVGFWGEHQAEVLHTGQGHLAKKSMPATMKAMGGRERKHHRACPCASCNDWQPYFPDDGEDFDPWKSEGVAGDWPAAA